LASQVAVGASIVGFCVGIGSVRRGHRTIGVALLFAAAVVVAALALFGNWRPLVGLIAIAGFLGGLEADDPRSPRRRALGVLGIAIGFCALLIAVLYV
jgi:hypothetical protein